MYTDLKTICRPKKEVFDNLQTGVYIVDFGLVQKSGFDELSNICGVCIYSKEDYIIINNSQYRPNYRYKALEDSALIRVELSDVLPEKLIKQVAELEDLLLIRSFKLSLNPLEPARFLHFANWIKSKTNRDDLDFLTHEDIGTFLSSSRVTIARIVSSLFHQGVIIKNRGKIEKFSTFNAKRL